LIEQERGKSMLKLKERIKTNLIERLCVKKMALDKKIKYMKIIYKL
jgi:hypothetical protein